jgi:hypothetical protein
MVRVTCTTLPMYNGAEPIIQVADPAKHILHAWFQLLLDGDSSYRPATTFILTPRGPLSTVKPVGAACTTGPTAKRPFMFGHPSGTATWPRLSTAQAVSLEPEGSWGRPYYHHMCNNHLHVNNTKSGLLLKLRLRKLLKRQFSAISPRRRFCRFRRLSYSLTDG